MFLVFILYLLVDIACFENGRITFLVIVFCCITPPVKIEKLNSTGLSSAEVPAVYFNENNNSNNAFYPRSIKLLCPAKSYTANLGRMKIINKGVIKLHVQKKGKEKE